MTCPNSQHKGAVRQSDLHAFAMVPRTPTGPNLDGPSLKGGGSKNVPDPCSADA